MSKAKAAPTQTMAATAAAKAATRRKAHPKFELPEEHGHAATDWAFRDEPNAPRAAIVPSLADIGADVPRHHAAPVTEETRISAPWMAPLFLTGAAIGGAAIGLGMAMLTAYAAVQVMTAPARIARSLF